MEERLKEHCRAALEYGIKPEQILGVFLYGSQNYKCDTPQSDVDTKVIIIPSLNDAIFKPPVVKELHLPSGEHCEIMDIRHFVSNLKKQNINFVEVLFTQYKLLNPAYMDLYKEYFIKNREMIARYDEYQTLRSICGQLTRTLRQNPRNGKKVGNGVRLNYFFHQYAAGKPYKDCLIPNKPLLKFIKELKSKEILHNDLLANNLITDSNKLVSEAKQTENPNKEFIDNQLYEGMLKMIMRLEGKE